MANGSIEDLVSRTIRSTQGGIHSSHVAMASPSPPNCEEELNPGRETSECKTSSISMASSLSS